MGAGRRKFTKEFKEAAVRRLGLGASLAEVARACEVNPNVCTAGGGNRRKIPVHVGLTRRHDWRRKTDHIAKGSGLWVTIAVRSPARPVRLRLETLTFSAGRCIPG